MGLDRAVYKGSAKIFAKICKSVFNIVKGQHLLIPRPLCSLLQRKFNIPLENTWGLTLLHLVVTDVRLQGDKHVRQPQVHFVIKTLDSRSFVRPDCFQRLLNFILHNAPLTTRCYRHLEMRARSYLPTPPLGQDMTQGQFLSGV